jgi:hemerythrin-like metal-binding protein
MGDRVPYIDWTKDLELGIPVIDRDHKVLVSIINQVANALGNNEERAVLGSALSSLSEYTDYHFAREEKLQEVAGYDGVEGHRQRHRELEDQVRQISSRYREDMQSVKADEVLAFLKTWLIDHILKHDLAYRDSCLDNQQAYAAAEAMTFNQSISSDGLISAIDAPKPVVWGEVRVLVVEDNRNFQLIIQTILKSLGVRNIEITSTGADGLERLQGQDIDLVLCDWRMEEMDGLAFVKKARDLGLSAKIIMMSGYGSEDIYSQAMAVGVDDFIEKPITARGFLETATRVLQQ